jgi:hypothetical protein
LCLGVPTPGHVAVEIRDSADGCVVGASGEGIVKEFEDLARRNVERVDSEVAECRDERWFVGDEARQEVAFREDAEAVDSGGDMGRLKEESEDRYRLREWPAVEVPPEAIEEAIDGPDEGTEVGVRGVMLKDRLSRAKKDDREVQLDGRGEGGREKREGVVDEELCVAFVEPMLPDVGAHRNEGLVDRLLLEIRIVARVGMDRARRADETSWRKIGWGKRRGMDRALLVRPPHRAKMKTN